MKLKNENCLNEKGMKLLNDFVIKGRDKLVELKNIYQEIKNCIHGFEKACENNIVFSRESIDKNLDKINYDIFNFDSYISQMKFEFNAYIFYTNNKEFSALENEFDNIVTYFKKYFKFKKKYIEINDNNLENISNYIYQDNFRLYFLFFEEKNLQEIVPYFFHCNNIFVILINNNKESEGNIFITKRIIKQMDIESIFRDKINQEIKNNLPFYSEEQMLMPTNLESKLIYDLNNIFKMKGNINIKGLLEKTKFEIPKEKEDELIKYFDKISEIFKIKDSSEIKNVFIRNLNKLKLNILSKHFYSIFFHKIGKHFKKKYEEELAKSNEKN